MSNLIKVNIVLKLEEKYLVRLEDELRGVFEVVSYRVLPDTQELYENSPTFRSLVKKRKEIQEEIDIYINEHG